MTQGSWGEFRYKALGGGGTGVLLLEVNSSTLFSCHENKQTYHILLPLINDRMRFNMSY